MAAKKSIMAYGGQQAYGENIINKPEIISAK